MRIDVFTIFPDMVDGFAGRACWARPGRGACSTSASTTCASATTDPHRSVDDSPYGGGAGMVLMAEPLFAAVEAVDPPRPLLLTSPGGRRFDQAWAARAGRRRRASPCCAAATRASTSGCAPMVDGELSIGDYVLAGGEVAAMVVLEAVGRLVPGVMGNEASADEESFSDGLLEYPQYTRPAGVAGSRGARGAALRRPRQGRRLAPGPGPRPHRRRPPGPHRRPGRPHGRRGGADGRSPAESPGFPPRSHGLASSVALGRLLRLLRHTCRSEESQGRAP